MGIDELIAYETEQVETCREAGFKEALKLHMAIRAELMECKKIKENALCGNIKK